MRFLRTAARLARRAAYSFHKTSTRPHLLRMLREEHGLRAEVVAEMRFDLPRTYRFHQRESVDVQVDLLRVCWEDGGGGEGREETTGAPEEEVAVEGHSGEVDGLVQGEDNAER